MTSYSEIPATGSLFRLFRAFFASSLTDGRRTQSVAVRRQAHNAFIQGCLARCLRRILAKMAQKSEHLRQKWNIRVDASQFVSEPL